MIDDKRTALLESTVRAVAKYGMKDISTRNISSDAGVNDAYIYRYFATKIGSEGVNLDKQAFNAS